MPTAPAIHDENIEHQIEHDLAKRSVTIKFKAQDPRGDVALCCFEFGGAEAVAFAAEIVRHAKEADPAAREHFEPGAAMAPFDVYEDYEGKYNVIDNRGRIVLQDVFAYDGDRANALSRMESIVALMNVSAGVSK